MQQSGREIPGDAKALWWWTTFHVLLLLTFFEAVACRLHVKKGQTADASEAFIIIIFQVCKLVNEDYKRTPNFPLTITLGFCKPLIYGEQNDVGL